MSRKAVFFGICFLLFPLVVEKAQSLPEKITFPYMMKGLTDLDRLWTPPVPGEKTVQFSSFDRASLKGPSDRDAWYANGDCGKYMRVEERKGRKELVMADAEGPGAVVRIWSANPKGNLYFYVDGAEEPTWTIPFQELTGGRKAPFLPPLSGVQSRGWNCYVPFLFKKRLKITADKGGVYYHVDVHYFPKGTDVESFVPSVLEKYADLIQETGKRLLGPPADLGKLEKREARFLFPPSRSEDPSPYPRKEILRIRGPLVVKLVEFRRPVSAEGNSLDLAAVLRNLQVSISVDGRETVRVPVSDFFGSAPGFKPYDAYPMEVTPGGTGRCWFPMPARREFVLALVGERPLPALQCGFLVAWEKRQLPPETLAFHASWHLEKHFRTRPRRDFTILDARGRGRFVGCMLMVANPVRGWWGEGDEKFWIDGESFPSTFGTGTEDYFGYAWCWRDLFSHPFHDQSQCDGPGNFGYTCVNRFQISDEVPFQRIFLFDLEVWHWVDCWVDYASTAYWYGAPGAPSGLPGLPPFELRKPGKIEPRKFPRVAGALEGESLKILKKDRGEAGPQGMRGYRTGFWSGGAQLWWRGAKKGDELVLELPVKKAGKYRFRAAFTKAADYGIVQLYLDGKKLGGPIDLYHDGVVPSGLKDFGVVDLPGGPVRLTLKIVGRNKASIPRFMAGLDYVLLDPAR